jgi:hypothetical protein
VASSEECERDSTVPGNGVEEEEPGIATGAQSVREFQGTATFTYLL